ncbi:hypothetical protein, partial [Phycicoccus flavus]
MSFFDRAKAAANDLAAKADVAMTNAGIDANIGGGPSPNKALRDLGVLAWLEATDRPVDPADRERVLDTLRELELSGRLGPLTVSPPETRHDAPPPPTGAAATAAATGSAAGMPAAPPPPPTGGTAPPPPPPPPGAA